MKANNQKGNKFELMRKGFFMGLGLIAAYVISLLALFTIIAVWIVITTITGA